MHLCIILRYVLISRCSISDIIRSEYGAPRGGWNAEMLSERATTAAAGVKGLITWKRFRASFQTRSGALVRQGARLRCRGRRNYAINPEIIPPSRSYGTAAEWPPRVFRTQPLVPRNLGALLSTEHEVEIRFFPRGPSFVARAYLAIKP